MVMFWGPRTLSKSRHVVHRARAQAPNLIHMLAAQLWRCAAQSCASCVVQTQRDHERNVAAASAVAAGAVGGIRVSTSWFVMKMHYLQHSAPTLRAMAVAAALAMATEGTLLWHGNAYVVMHYVLYVAYVSQFRKCTEGNCDSPSLLHKGGLAIRGLGVVCIIYIL